MIYTYESESLNIRVLIYPECTFIICRIASDTNMILLELFSNNCYYRITHYERNSSWNYYVASKKIHTAEEISDPKIIVEFIALELPLALANIKHKEIDYDNIQLHNNIKSAAN